LPIDFINGMARGAAAFISFRGDLRLGAVFDIGFVLFVDCLATSNVRNQPRRDPRKGWI
jgi:hypothetical protein